MRRRITVSLFAGLLLASVLLNGCSQEPKKLDSLTTNISSIEESQFIFDCPAEVYEPRQKNENSIGYMCSVLIEDDTELIDEERQRLDMDSFAVGDTIHIQFHKPQKMSREHRSYIAAQIMLLK
ncbi:hypothetical protein J40TS1_27610 [Paenibacillus montaniterrae]|uniref:DUF3221 domain-containing protein n=2 Tax=Paenibacillus montaniterrae TaxID=429341 RepID=A0A919YRZ1_9BACL|nr:hypothetical protein J40TS1_27610 [Paenibacillus montaniterrae]